MAYTLESSVEEDLAAGRLVRVLEDWCAPFPGFFLYYPGRRQMRPALRALIDFLAIGVRDVDVASDLKERANRQQPGRRKQERLLTRRLSSRRFAARAIPVGPPDKPKSASIPDRLG